MNVVRICVGNSFDVILAFSSKFVIAELPADDQAAFSQRIEIKFLCET
jgi:hypothetical protein